LPSKNCSQNCPCIAGKAVGPGFSFSGNPHTYRAVLAEQNHFPASWVARFQLRILRAHNCAL
jgi:hypothetical protein